VGKNSQITGNVGLYFVCYHLSRLGWNAMPTSRNSKGIDILAVSADCTRKISLQVKTLSKRVPVPLGKTVKGLLGDFWIIVNNVASEPGIFIMKPEEVRAAVHEGVNDEGKKSYWLQPGSYDKVEFRDKWERIGEP
jgi:hypothetical protein